MALKHQLQATFHTATLLLITVMSLAAAQPLQLSYRRRPQSGIYFQPGDNQIVLQCERGTTAIPNPQIWVERSDLARQPVRIVNNQGGEVTIVINQDIEGLYSCSDNHGVTSTNTLKLVGKEESYQIHKLVSIIEIISSSFFFCSLPRSKSLHSFILCLSGRTTGNNQLSYNAWKIEPILQCYVVE